MQAKAWDVTVFGVYVCVWGVGREEKEGKCRWKCEEEKGECKGSRWLVSVVNNDHALPIPPVVYTPPKLMCML